MLINGKLDIEKNKPINNIFSSTMHNHQTINDMVLNDFDYFKKYFNINNWNKNCIFFGAVFIDLKKFVDFNFWEKLKKSYKEILEQSPSKSSNSFFADMGLFSLVLAQLHHVVLNNLMFSTL